MEFKDITDKDKVYPGEYLLYKPQNQIVLCGAFSRQTNIIRVLHQGRYLEDKIENFKKINLSGKERKERKVSRCKKCGKG
jgi:hypothetical protein